MILRERLFQKARNTKKLKINVFYCIFINKFFKNLLFFKYFFAKKI